MSSSNLLSKREVLKGLAALGATSLLPSLAGGVGREAWTPGLQLYTLGDLPKKDLNGTLQEIAKIGYRAVEFASHYRRSAKDLRAALDRAGLKAVGSHVGLRPSADQWSLGDDLSHLADNIKTVGGSYVVISGPLLDPGAKGLDAIKSATADDWKRTAALLNEKGAALAPSGVRVGYHNHAWEFLPLRTGGGTGFDVLVKELDPALVDFQVDVGWVASAGQDPVAIMNLLGKRLRLMHLKDCKSASSNAFHMDPADVGTGMVDWPKVVQAIRRLQVPHLLVEQEPPFPTTPMDAVRVAYKYLSGVFAKAG